MADPSEAKYKKWAQAFVCLSNQKSAHLHYMYTGKEDIYHVSIPFCRIPIEKTVHLKRKNGPEDRHCDTLKGGESICLITKKTWSKSHQA